MCVEDKKTSNVEELPDLTGRKAKCMGAGFKCNCDGIVDSSWDLPLFIYQPDRAYDIYYCGCDGWD